MIAAMIVRLIFASSGLAFQTDLNTFKAWADLVFLVGMQNFYLHDAFTDYPPGYMYVLFVIGWLRQVLALDFHSTVYDIIMMTPAIIADLATGYVIYRLATKKLPSYAVLVAALYLLNPVIILDSAVWGQVDSVYLLPVIVSIMLLIEKRYLAGYLLYALAIMIKPQALILAPIYLYSFWVVIRDEGDVKTALYKLTRWGLASAALMFVIMLPFTRNFNIMPILLQYADTLGSYPFATLNAYNFHALVGAMWQPMDTLFLGVPLYVIGYGSIVLVTFLSLYLLRRDGSPANIFYVAALLSAVVFVFSVRMHERYLYPAIPLLLIAFIYRPDRRIFALFAGFTLTFTVNVIDALRMLNNGVNLDFLVNETWVSVLNVGMVVAMVIIAFVMFGREQATEENVQCEQAPRVSDPLAKYFEKYEWRILAALVVIYAIIAFVRLGDMHAPQSFWDMRWHKEEVAVSQEDTQIGASIVGNLRSPQDFWDVRTYFEEEPFRLGLYWPAIIDMGEYVHIDGIQVYLGGYGNQSIAVYTSDTPQDLGSWRLYGEFSLQTAFAWHGFEVDMYTRYIRISAASDRLIIGEIGLWNNGIFMQPRSVYDDWFFRRSGFGGQGHFAERLFSEPHTVPRHFTTETIEVHTFSLVPRIPAIIDLGEPTRIDKLQAYLGAREHQHFAVYTSNAHPHLRLWQRYREFELVSVFAWHDFDVDLYARYIRIMPLSGQLMIGELGLRNNGELVTPAALYDELQNRELGEGLLASLLFDEQHTVPAHHHFMNSTYFDEIYHPRTAFEFIHGMYVYENTHPPLGKVIQSWGIRIFGMTPFGWRFTGTFVGVLMIIPMYLLARELFAGNKGLAFVAAGLFTFDFMHFAQTRLATIDTYVTFFVILMYLFMYMYYSESASKSSQAKLEGDFEADERPHRFRVDFYPKTMWHRREAVSLPMPYKGSLRESSFRKDMLWLFLSGLCMGLGIAGKWQGVYAGAGLAVLWCIAMVRRYIEYRELSADIETSDKSVRCYPRETFATIGLCFVFFVAVPVAVYALSYIDYLRTPGMSGIASIIDNQVHMFTYHAGIDQPHPFSAYWWEWPLNLRPMFMYLRWHSPGMAEGISSFGNPIVWWGGLIGMFYAFYRLFDTRRPCSIPVFLVVSFMAQFAPWIFVTRTTYIYHYFPSVPFITLAFAYMLGEVFDARRPWVKYAVLSAAIVLFAMFYPVLSGLPVSTWYVDTFLRWISTWRLI